MMTLTSRAANRVKNVNKDSRTSDKGFLLRMTIGRAAFFFRLAIIAPALQLLAVKTRGEEEER